MKNAEREAYLELRAGARQLLDILGVASNPMVSNEWIIDQLRAKKGLQPEVEIESQENSETSDLTLFQNSLTKIITDLGKSVPKAEHQIDAVLEARRLIYFLHEIFSRKTKKKK